MNRILLVDGSNLLFQMFFGMPAHIYNEEGVGIWGVLGFVGALLKIIRRTAPTHVAVLFDGEHENQRTDIDENYKANRPSFADVPDEENPFSQLPHIYEALDYLGLAHAETTDCETDDWMAGYAWRYGADNEIIISSFDSDFFQLISENVSILRYRGEKTVLCDGEYLWNRCGVTPEQYADFKCLVGDTADNIPGAEHVGPKTAAALLNQFGTLDAVLDNAEAIQRNAIRASIQRNKTRLKQNQSLIRLSPYENLPFPLETLSWIHPGLTTTQVLRGIGLR